jgi:nickel/cobalt exporter
MCVHLITATLLAAWSMILAAPAAAHPLGNFSISHYSRIHIGKDAVEVKYVIDLAEIPTFQEIQESGIAPDVHDINLQAFLARKSEKLRDGLSLRVGGKLLWLEVDSTDIIFPPGAGGLPTMKIGILFKGKLAPSSMRGEQSLEYRDGNFLERAGWKEIIATTDRGVTLTNSSVAATDRSRQLSDYPTDLLNSPPQQLEAHISFIVVSAPAVASVKKPISITKSTEDAVQQSPNKIVTEEEIPGASTNPRSTTSSADHSMQLSANRQATPRSSFTELMATRQLNVEIVLVALAVAMGLGAFHALEPGHGKTLVAAYLVGSRGTFKHALLLGLIVTASHTAGVYLLGAATLYASQYIVPEQLYPWLGLVSGVMIIVLGSALLLRRYRNSDGLISHHHGHTHPHPHHSHDQEHHHHGSHAHRHHEPIENVSLKQLLALGISGGIVPCPAALVVLLSAVSMHRIGFGLVLIAAFSAGLAVVLITVGVLMVYARRFMSRFHGEGRVITRWLPMTSSAFIVLFGVGLTWQALVSAGFIRL